jgi:D-sedoheptulose 7-phosphate isomerase
MHLLSSHEAVLSMLDESAAAIAACHALADEITRVAECIADALRDGHLVLVCGNGGSAADAQHFAGELMGRFLASRSERAPRPAVALTADSAVLTCIANDYSYEDIFARQVRGLARAGDVVFGISTSGASPNVLRALQAAPRGAHTIALCGRGGPIADCAELAIKVPYQGTAPIQAAHIAIIHAICLVLEERFAQDETAVPSASMP